jgi:hypothetical protein
MRFRNDRPPWKTDRRLVMDKQLKKKKRLEHWQIIAALLLIYDLVVFGDL